MIRANDLRTLMAMPSLPESTAELNLPNVLLFSFNREGLLFS